MTSVDIREVALRAGVSVGTVSNVLNRPDRVSPATRRRVTDAIDELGFVRNDTARSLRSGRGTAIGVVLLDLGNPYYADLVAGVEDVTGPAGIAVVLCDGDRSAGRARAYLDLLQEQRVLGVLVTPDASIDEPVERLRARGTPVVLLDGRGGPEQCTVSVDDRLGGVLAVDHLLARGHSLMAFVGDLSSGRPQVRDRYEGGVAALTRDPAGRATLSVVEVPELTPVCGRTAGDHLAGLDAARRPTAVFCANDLVALGVLQALTRHGLAVPDDVALVGFDDIAFAAAAAVPLTSVGQPRAEIGRTAVELLLDELADPSGHRHREVVLRPELRVRRSSAPNGAHRMAAAIR